MMWSLPILLAVCSAKAELAHSFQSATPPSPSWRTSSSFSRHELSKNNGQRHHYYYLENTSSSSLSPSNKLTCRNQNTALSASSSSNNNNNNNDSEEKEDKFSLFQRIESTKTAVIGLLSGGILATPFIALHDLPTYGTAAWEFDTDMGSLQSALFAIVYRYCIREEDDNDMLNAGVVGAFVAVRTLSRIRVPRYCTAVPLDCGDPLGYFDYDMLRQLALNGAESAALFGGAALAMEYAYSKKWVSKFPN